MYILIMYTIILENGHVDPKIWTCHLICRIIGFKCCWYEEINKLNIGAKVTSNGLCKKSSVYGRASKNADNFKIHY